MSKKIGFIGLGNMGKPMAINLLKAGYDLIVFDVVADAVNDLVSQGARDGKTVLGTVQDVDVVITMLPSGQIVKNVYLDEAVFDHARQGTLFIDSSTINAQDARDVSMVAKSKGFSMIDAPVSGGTAGATAGTLTFIMGGEVNAIDQATPVLNAMGANLFHAGGNGAGQMAKICNNMLLGILMVGTSEALLLGEKYGLDPEVLSKIMSKSSGNNWVLDKYNPMPNVMENVPAANDYAGGFSSTLMLKDVTLSQKIAEDLGIDTPLGKAVKTLYEAHNDKGWSNKDFSSIIQYLKGN